MLFNIYMIETTAWDVRAEGVPVSPSLEDYALANTFNFSRGTIIGYPNTVLAIYDVHNNLGTTYSGEVNLTRFDWVIIQKKGLELEPRTETIAVLEHLAFECPAGYNKIYESDNLVVVVKARAGS
jgi:hypothetical protein